MKNEIQIFNNPDFGEVRVAEVNGEPHFVAKDVAEKLGYTWHHNLVSHIPEEWKGSNRITTPGGTQEVITLSEQGLYFFLARSDKPLALPFQKWIAGEVLPSIRKTGAYSIQSRLPGTFSEALRQLADKIDENEKLQQKIIDDQPKVDFAEHVSNSSNAISLRDFSKLLCNERINIGQNRLFNWMRTKKYLLKDNTPYQEYIDKGFFKIIEQTFQTAYGKQTSVKTLITGKGQIYFTEKLRKQAY
jgi:anti-repressor protein